MVEDDFDVDEILPRVDAKRQSAPLFPLHWDTQLSPEPQQWLVDGIIPEGGMSVLYSSEGVGKSFVALGWSLSVAAGISWFGRKTKQGDVVYAAAEGKSGIYSRVAAWRSAFDFASDESLGVGFVFNAIRLMDEASVNAFCRSVVQQEAAPKLVVVDTLARHSVGLDENSAQHMGMCVSGIDRIRDQLGCAVLVCHHASKPNAEGYSRIRGSSALAGAADTVFTLKVEPNELGAFTLMNEKIKEGERMAPIRMRLVREGQSAIAVPEGKMLPRVSQETLPWD